MINFTHLSRSLRHAFHGIRLAAHENTFRALLVIAVFAVLLMALFPLSGWQLVAIVLVLMVVLVLEVLNTVFERVADLVEPKMHHLVRELKDLMAAAVFIASLAALIIGLVIFLPYVNK